jgi:predicted NBD/HSP70 family sugar kinase
MSREGLVEVIGSATGGRSLLRRMNTLGILGQIMDSPRSMAELVAASGLSRTAVDAVIGDLVELGWVEAGESASGRPGRPAATFGLQRGLGAQASIDIGGHHIYAVLADLAGAELGSASIRVGEADSAETRLEAAAGVLDGLLADAGLAHDDLWIVGIGSPGTIDGGVVGYFGGEGMPGWTGLDLRSWFTRRFGTAVLVEGDVALGAEAELAVGAARGRQDVVYVLCGVRTSGAAIVGGRVHRGVHGAAGIIGELPQLRWAELESAWSRGRFGDELPSREDVFALARQGDPDAIAATDEFADALATGASALILALDPELVVVGGGSSPSADVFLPRMRETIARLCPIAPEVVASTLGSEAVALGALSLASRRLHSVLTSTVGGGAAFPTPADARRMLVA